MYYPTHEAPSEEPLLPSVELLVEMLPMPSKPVEQGPVEQLPVEQGQKYFKGSVSYWKLPVRLQNLLKITDFSKVDMELFWTSTLVEMFNYRGVHVDTMLYRTKTFCDMCRELAVRPDMVHFLQERQKLVLSESVRVAQECLDASCVYDKKQSLSYGEVYNLYEAEFARRVTASTTPNTIPVCWLGGPRLEALLGHKGVYKKGMRRAPYTVMLVGIGRLNKT